MHISTKMANPRTGGEEKPVSRAYTPISTNTHLGKLDLVIKTYYKDEHPRFPDGGWLSQYMDNMKVGDELDFKGPTGKIVYDGNGVFDIKGEKKKYKRIGCISGGTGVTTAVYFVSDAPRQAGQTSKGVVIDCNDATCCRKSLM